MQRRRRFPQHWHAARARRIASGCGCWERAWHGHPPSPREALNDPGGVSLQSSRCPLQNPCHPKRWPE
ncbi:hypothetical protein I79_021402 [Cricetulus griseus]|uniref:Uncharacterized protein n=1 Tax=Cricetulus griseus TaxID=10029 RepID=G3ICK4_CRIGR|nr:hypothetical protein I79_021402 [Cricetulus griseus]